MSTENTALYARLDIMEHHLRDLAEAARLLVESGVLQLLVDHLPTALNSLHPSQSPPFKDERKLFLFDVLNYLGISERSYYRKVAQGKLVPRKWEGPDYFYRSDLDAEYAESKRRGRV